MGEKEPKEGYSIKTVIANLESTNNITDEDRYIAGSLRELYQSDSYRSAVPPGTPSEQGLIKGLRIIRNTGEMGNLLSFVVSLESLEKKDSRLMNTIRRETKKLPIKDNQRIDPMLEHLALNTLKKTGLNTVGSMAIIEGSTSGKQIVEVRYPIVFMNVDPSVPPSRKETAALALAMYFLKRVTLK